MIPKLLILTLLIGAVIKFGKPMRAAVVYGVLNGTLALLGGEGIPSAAAGAAVALGVSAPVFWLIDWADGILLSVVVTVLGVGVLTFI